MKYLYNKFENEHIWIEMSDNGVAERQILIDQAKKIHVSCVEDCLAEGIIIENEIDGIVKSISKNDFENKWQIYTSELRKSWERNKRLYPIGRSVFCRVRYFYPQGCIVGIEGEEVLGLCINSMSFCVNDPVIGRIEGYNEVNMWLLISDTKKP